MRHLTTQTGLICAALMLSASEAWALPNCPSNPNAIWTNCVGTITSASGGSYVGEWQNNQFNGQGTYTYASGASYVGEFKDGQFNGQGTKTNANGDVYVGEWQNHQLNGQGTYTFANGATYVGEWLDGKFNGQGTINYASGNIYVGEFKDDQRNGQGTFTSANGDSYVGEWKDNQANGQGTATYASGNTYVGEFKDNQFNGQGTYTYANGDSYVGEWKDNKRHGQGTATYADGTVEEGIWENGEFKYANRAEPPVVSETKPQDDETREAASGSGFAVSSDGYVITNNHVIEGCQEVAIYHGGRAVPVTVITYDLQNDLALLKGDFTPRTVFALSGDQPELLQDIYVAGYPFGNEVSSSIKVTKGIISSLAGIGNNFSNIQIDAALQVGNSGGPILDEMGNIVGVAVSKEGLKNLPFST